MEDQNKNLILATVLSFVVILVWYTFFAPPEPVPQSDQPAVVAQIDAAPAGTPSTGAAETTANELAQAPAHLH